MLLERIAKLTLGIVHHLHKTVVSRFGNQSVFSVPACRAHWYLAKKLGLDCGVVSTLPMSEGGHTRGKVP